MDLSGFRLKGERSLGVRKKAIVIGFGNSKSLSAIVCIVKGSQTVAVKEPGDIWRWNESKFFFFVLVAL